MHNAFVVEEKNRKRAMVTLEFLFILSAVVLANIRVPDLSTIQWVLFGFAVVRMARTISFNEIAKPLREPFTYEKSDSCKAGKNTEVRPDATGARYVIGSLLSCPICTGQWSALVLYGLNVVSPKLGLTFVYIIGVAGISELLNWVIDYFQWQSRSARVVAGKISPDEE